MTVNISIILFKSIRSDIMLVLLLSLFSSYGLLRGYRTAPVDSSETPLAERIHKSVHEIDSLLKDFQLEIRKEKSVLRSVDQEIKDIGILDYSITPAWWGGSSGTLQTGINMISTLFPTPEGHFSSATKDPWDKLNLPGIQPNYSPSDVFEVVPNHGYVPDYSYQLNHTPFTPRLTYYPPETDFDPYNDPKFVPPTDPSYSFIVSTPSTSSVPDHYFNYISYDTNSAGSPTFRLPTKTQFPRPGFRGSPSTFIKGVTMSELYKKLMRDRTGYKPYGNRKEKANRLTTLPHRPQKLGRTLSKAQAWVQNRQWLKTNKAGKTLLGHIRQGLDDPVNKPPVQEKPAEVENSVVEKKPAEVENAPVEKKPAEVETVPVEKKPAEVENAPVEKAPDNADNSPIEKLPDNAENFPIEKGPHVTDNSPVGETTDGNKIVYSTDSFGTFSLPALTDIIPSLSIPGLDEVSLTTALALGPTSPTTPDILDVESSATNTAFTDELLLTDEQGFLFVKSPTSIPVSTETTTSTIGQLLLNAENFTATTPAALLDNYHELMDKRDEGYLMVFFLELSRIIAHKTENDVASVLAHVEGLYNELYERGGLAFLNEQIIELGTKVSQMFSGNNIGVLRSHANMMNQMLTGRAEYLSAEVNSIIDYADMLYEDDEGESLFEALRMFEAFPTADVSSRDLCHMLIHNFLKPYRRLGSTERLRKLTDSIIKVLVTKFGRRSGGVRIIPRVTTERHPSRKKKHQPQPLKRKLQMKRHRKSYQRHQPDNLFKRQRQVYTTVMMVRNLLPITKHQRRFHIMTPRQLRSNRYMNVVRPTVEYLRRRLGRPVHPPNTMLQLFPQVKKVEYMRRAQITDEEKHHPGGSANQQTLGTMKNEVRRIAAESSYSDEEASLKMNLRHALRVNWHKTSTPLPSQ